MRDFLIQFINKGGGKEKTFRPEKNTFSYGRHKDLITRGMHEARDRLNARSSRGSPNVSKYSACV